VGTFILHIILLICGCFRIVRQYRYLCPDCPTTVRVSPSREPFMEGDVLACVSNGYPEPSYTWTDTDGVIVSTANTMKLLRGWFNLTCTASGNFTTSCNASYAVSGFANGKNNQRTKPKPLLSPAKIDCRPNSTFPSKF